MYTIPGSMLDDDALRSVSFSGVVKLHRPVNQGRILLGFADRHPDNERQIARGEHVHGKYHTGVDIKAGNDVVCCFSRAEVVACRQLGNKQWNVDLLMVSKKLRAPVLARYFYLDESFTQKGSVVYADQIIGNCYDYLHFETCYRKTGWQFCFNPKLFADGWLAEVVK